MIGLGLALIALLLAAVPAGLFCANIRRYQKPAAPPESHANPRVSVLIPARNEARGIEAAVRAVLASELVDVQVLVLDDDSTDATAQIVESLAEHDSRVQLIRGGPLPAGWCGKQHACHLLAMSASERLLLFMDADVRLHPQGVARSVAFLERSQASLASGFPRQVTSTWMERLVIPLMHFVLLGFLPLARMRASRHPAYGAGCGQLILVRREDYWIAGGHRAIRTSLHDGVKLPRAMRTAGYATDLFDATDLASCRMYHDAGEVWRGLSKNAHEGLAAPRTILPATIALFGGQVMPFVLMLLFLAGYLGEPAGWAAFAAVGLAYLPRLIAAKRFRQGWTGAIMHPLGVSVLLAIQWQAFLRHVLGRTAEWKGRRYGAVDPIETTANVQSSAALDVDRSGTTSRLR